MTILAVKCDGCGDVSDGKDFIFQDEGEFCEDCFNQRQGFYPRESEKGRESYSEPLW